jgi:hypothetical protein
VLYLSGHIREGLAGLHPTLGYMYTPIRWGKHEAGVWWGADNGCFTRPERFSEAKYFAWLESRLEHIDRCVLVTAQDVLGDAAATLAASAPMLPKIRAMGYPAALVFQDGLEALSIPWDSFDVAFIGGTTAWKLGPAWALVEEARSRGKWVHVGRVNSLARLRACRAAGVDSTDGTHLRYATDCDIPQWLRLLDAVDAQPGLFV